MTDKTVSFRVDEEYHEFLEEFANSRGTSISEIQRTLTEGLRYSQDSSYEPDSERIKEFESYFDMGVPTDDIEKVLEFHENDQIEEGLNYISENVYEDGRLEDGKILRKLLQI